MQRIAERTKGQPQHEAFTKRITPLEIPANHVSNDHVTNVDIWRAAESKARPILMISISDNVRTFFGIISNNHLLSGMTALLFRGCEMEYPGFNSFWNLSEDIVAVLLAESPLTTQHILDRLKENGLHNVDLDYRTQVPVALDHVSTVLTTHLCKHVDQSAGGWQLMQRPELPPIWKMFRYPFGSMGYRMGRGEDYWHKWEDWYRGLDEHTQKEYSKRHPEPVSWRHFYEMVSINPGNTDAMMPVIDKIRAAEADYVASEYKIACSCEQNGEIDQAIYHFSEVIMRGDQFPDAQDRYEALQREYDANAT